MVNTTQQTPAVVAPQATDSVQTLMQVLTPRDVLEPRHAYALPWLVDHLGLAERDLRHGVEMERTRREEERKFWLRNCANDDLHPRVLGADAADWIERNSVQFTLSYSAARDWKERQEREAQQVQAERCRKLARFVDLLELAAGVNGHRPLGYWELLLSGSTGLDDAQRLETMMVMGSLSSNLVEKDIEVVRVAKRLVELWPLLQPGSEKAAAPVKGRK